MCYWDYRWMMRKEEKKNRRGRSGILIFFKSMPRVRIIARTGDTNRCWWTRGDAACRRWRCARGRTAGRSSRTRCPCRMPVRRVSRPWGPQRRDTWWSRPWGARPATLTCSNVDGRGAKSATSAAGIRMVWNLDPILAFLLPPFPSFFPSSVTAIARLDKRRNNQLMQRVTRSHDVIVVS